ncbi:hypothetical protein AMECASPLE_036012 [Ameca splendens]|uniref:Uncharacterized protein n=1 Tax=Ameca splendens TaxID=208324 RepID=A0ABV0XKK8_9TELE
MRMVFFCSYREIKHRGTMEENLLVAAKYLKLGQRLTLQQDNDPKHTARAMVGGLKCGPWAFVALGIISCGPHPQFKNGTNLALHLLSLMQMNTSSLSELKFCLDVLG